MSQMSVTKKVPPYLRSTKPPYTIFTYSPVLAARVDMVPWYEPPVVQRVEPVLERPEIETAPDLAMSEAEFNRMVAEKARVEALKAAAKGAGAIEADKRGVKAVKYDVNTPFEIEARPDDALTEADFDRIKEPEQPTGPTEPMAHDDIPIDAPVEGTFEGNAAKRHGKATRKKSAVDEFAGITPPDARAPSVGPKAPQKSPFGTDRRY